MREAVVAYFNVLCWALSAGTEENHDQVQSRLEHGTSRIQSRVLTARGTPGRFLGDLTHRNKTG
jgi:hypothetical protein